MNLEDLVRAVEDVGFTTREAKLLVTTTLDVIKNALANHQLVQLPFGTLKVVPNAKSRRGWRLDRIVTLYQKPYRISFTTLEGWDRDVDVEVPDSSTT